MIFIRAFMVVCLVMMTPLGILVWAWQATKGER